MELLKLKDFEKAYPHLVRRIDEIRGKKIADEYLPNKIIPISMQDAAFVDSFLKVNNPQINYLGYEKSKKILEIVELYPNIDNWLNILYPKANIVKKQNNKKIKCIKETVLWPKIDDSNNYYCIDSDKNTYYTDTVPIDRIERSLKSKKIIRMSVLENGKRKFRIMKPETFGEKFETGD